MKLYHSTTEGLAQAVLDEGFCDEGVAITYLADCVFTGVWLSDCQLGWNEGAEGDVALTVEIDGRTIRRYEWMEEGRTYREWLIPAALLNARAITKRAYPIAPQAGERNQR